MCSCCMPHIGIERSRRQTRRIRHIHGETILGFDRIRMSYTFEVRDGMSCNVMMSCDVMRCGCAGDVM